MSTAWQLAKLPFKVLFGLIKMVFLPALLGVVGWLVLPVPSIPFVILEGLAALWALALIYLWRLQVRGTLRSLGRGAVHVSNDTRRQAGLRRDITPRPRRLSRRRRVAQQMVNQLDGGNRR